MTVRRADRGDFDAMGTIARRSMRASYAISPARIDEVVEDRFDDDRLAGRVDREDSAVVLAERDADALGFAVGSIDGDAGEIAWLHVVPERRGEGVGTALFEQLRDVLNERGVTHLRARVLAANAEGAEFAEARGFRRIGRDRIAVGGEPLVEHVYADGTAAHATHVDARADDGRADDGRTFDVERGDPAAGTEAPVFDAYRNTARSAHLGLYCANCGTLVGAVDGLGRIRCGECGNTHRPDRWDRAYL